MSAVCPNGHTSDSTDYCDTCGAPIPEGAVTPGAAGTAAPAASVGAVNSLDLPPVGAPAAPAGPKDCPNCQTANAPESLFCEACGYDFTTGALPASVVAAEAESAAEGTPDGSGELGGLAGAEELDAAGASVSAEGEAGEGEPGPGEPGDLGQPAADPGSAASQAAGDPAGDLGGADGGIATGVGGVPPRIAFQWVAEVWIDPDWYADQQATEPLPSAGLPAVVPLRVASALIGRKSSSRNIAPDIDCSSDPGVSRRHAQLTTDGTRWFVEDLQSSNGTFVGPASGPLPDDPIAVGPKTEVGDNRIYLGAWTRVVVRRATDEEIAIG
ncbi:FHA domain-containing protein [Nostocoides vanveenii]|uniref:FHA domain-containing protein n=1 Tax=Nostocoides vanveenii TaxID=330835 RepID=A0ABN2KCP8_9MICO